MTRPTILTVLGILTIVFGSLGVMANCCGYANLGFTGVMHEFLAPLQKQIDAQQQARHQQYLDDLEAATTDDERAQIEKNYQTWKDTNPPIDVAAMYAWTRDPRFIGQILVDSTLSLITNVLLIVAGTGLLKMRPGARTLGMATAIAKLVINAAVGVYSLLVTLPMQEESMRPMMDRLEKIQQNQPVPSMQFQQTMGRVGAVIGIATSCLFPIVLLVMLNLSGVRKALIASSPQTGT
jgi:hypothetical protein